MRRVSMLCLLAAAVAVPTIAAAGYNAAYEVYIEGARAQGTIVGARRSTDPMMYMMCVDGDYAYCIAVTSDAVQSCYSIDDHQRAVIRSVGPTSVVYFERADDGHCDRVFVYNGSQYLE